LTSSVETISAGGWIYVLQGNALSTNSGRPRKVPQKTKSENWNEYDAAKEGNHQ
jgi:hypothetical protein